MCGAHTYCLSCILFCQRCDGFPMYVNRNVSHLPASLTRRDWFLQPQPPACTGHSDVRLTVVYSLFYGMLPVIHISFVVRPVVIGLYGVWSTVDERVGLLPPERSNGRKTLRYYTSTSELGFQQKNWSATEQTNTKVWYWRELKCVKSLVFHIETWNNVLKKISWNENTIRRGLHPYVFMKTGWNLAPPIERRRGPIALQGCCVWMPRRTRLLSEGTTPSFAPVAPTVGDSPPRYRRGHLCGTYMLANLFRLGMWLPVADTAERTFWLHRQQKSLSIPLHSTPCDCLPLFFPV